MSAITSLNCSIEKDMASLITYTSVAVFITVVKKPLLPGYIVFVIAFYMKLSSSIGGFLILAISNMINGYVSLKRINVN